MMQETNDRSTREPRRPRGTRLLRLAILGFIALLAPASHSPRAQEATAISPAVAEPDTFGWRNSLAAGTTLGQSAFSNWAPGGTSSIAWSTTLRGTFKKVAPGYTWRHQGNIEYGLLKQEGEDLRKSVDLIEGETLYTLMLHLFVDPYASAGVKTQFTTGRDFSAVPDTAANGDLVFPATSDFADPLYLSQSAGVSRTLIPDEFTTRLGFTVRETITDVFRGYAINDDEENNGLDFAACIGNPACDKTKVETGLESITEYEKKLAEATGLTSKLALFYSFEQPDELDVNWRSDLTIKALDLLNVNFGLELVLDQDVVDKLQAKQVMGLGVSFNLL